MHLPNPFSRASPSWIREIVCWGSPLWPFIARLHAQTTPPAQRPSLDVGRWMLELKLHLQRTETLLPCRLFPDCVCHIKWIRLAILCNPSNRQTRFGWEYNLARVIRLPATISRCNILLEGMIPLISTSHGSSPPLCPTQYFMSVYLITLFSVLLKSHHYIDWITWQEKKETCTWKILEKNLRPIDRPQRG